MGRGVRQYDSFTGAFVALVPREDARAAIMRGIEQTICENPLIGEAVDNLPGSCWFSPLAEAPGWGTPRMVVTYTFDDDEVQLVWIGISDQG